MISFYNLDMYHVKIFIYNMNLISGILSLLNY